MSIQKLKSIKPIKGIDTYSKNPIIDSLIKQKLQSQMKGVKDNFNVMMRKEELRQKESKHVRMVKKRTLSVQELQSITAERVRESLNYRPTINKGDQAVVDFVTDRQYSSPFFEQNHIESLNLARTDREDFYVKMRSEDKVNLENQHSQSDPAFYQNLQAKVKEQLPSGLWLPAQAEVRQIITTKLQENSSIHPFKSQFLNLSLTNRPSSSQLFSPLKSNRLKKLQRSNSATKNIEITYEPKKYHKSDYQSLQRWLQIAVDFVNREAKEVVSNGPKIQQHLNQIYTIYICTIKELIRLTYIESAEKGLILQKIIWSMIRLFEELISEQHKTNYNDFKSYSQEIKEERELYDDRMKKLEARLGQTQFNLKRHLQEKSKIALTGITYKKVNEQMNNEITKLMTSVTELKKQNDFLMANLIKLIRQFQQRNLIRIKKSQDHDIYFYLNSKDQIQVVAKVQNSGDLQSHFENEMEKTSLQALEEQSRLKKNNINQLENTLTTFWEKKKTYLDIQGIVREHFMCSVCDGAVQVDGRGPNEYTDISTQFPEQGVQTFEMFLKKQLTHQRQKWSRKEEEYQTMQISLKNLYDQMKESIDILSSKNKTYKTSLDHKDNELSFLNKKLEQLQTKTTLLLKKITFLEKDIEKHIDEQDKLKEKIEEERGRLIQQKKKFMFEKENNNILASNIFELKEKNQHLVAKFEGLEDKIQSVAPYLEETLALPEASELLTLINLTQAVQKYLGEYVERDAKVFLTK